MDDKLLILNGNEIENLLLHKEGEVVAGIKKAYELHHNAQTQIPYSQFLRFRGNNNNRIISLPAYLGGQYDVAGIKWIASFPENIYTNSPRASGILILNSTKNGRPKAIMEVSVISRMRTAASALLAIEYLYDGTDIGSIGIIGCGVINLEIVRFLNILRKDIRKIFIYDIDSGRAEIFKGKCIELNGSLDVEVIKNLENLMPNTRLLSFATNASGPYFIEESCIQKNSLLLNISLRDLSPDIILKAYNVVDDIDHVLREKTSLHLTELQVGHRDFIHSTIGKLIVTDVKNICHQTIKIFSPFGLGILDLAVGTLLYKLSIESGTGLLINSFFPNIK